MIHLQIKTRLSEEEERRFADELVHRIMSDLERNFYFTEYHTGNQNCPPGFIRSVGQGVVNE